MCRMLVSVCLALALTSVCSAAVMSSWEDGQADGWSSAWGGPYTLIPAQFGNGSATDGTYSLGILPVAGQYWSVSYNGNANFAGATTFSFDMTIKLGDGWSNDSWVNSDKLAIQNNTSWSWDEVPHSAITIQVLSGGSPGAPDNNGNVAYWNTGMGDIQWRISYNLAGVPSADLFNGAYSLYWALQYSGTTPGLVYVDNVQITPEPATMALLGLGGLALIRRKR